MGEKKRAAAIEKERTNFGFSGTTFLKEVALVVEESVLTDALACLCGKTEPVPAVQYNWGDVGYQKHKENALDLGTTIAPSPVSIYNKDLHYYHNYTANRK